MSEPIYLQVCAGLANRLRATVSGLCAAEELGREIIISWPTEYAFGATWNDLFEPQAWVATITASNLRMCLSPQDWETEKERKTIRIKSYGAFTRPASWLGHLRSLRPLKVFQDRVTELFGGVTPIGVHIRRTDNLKAILASPTSAFVEAMDKMKGPFYVATDDEKEYEAMAARYPIIRREAFLERHSVRGIQDALVDFIALSRCSLILGSAASSFSEIAAAYGDTPLRIIL